MIIHETSTNSKLSHGFLDFSFSWLNLLPSLGWRVVELAVPRKSPFGSHWRSWVISRTIFRGSFAFFLGQGCTFCACRTPKSFDEMGKFQLIWSIELHEAGIAGPLETLVNQVSKIGTARNTIMDSVSTHALISATRLTSGTGGNSHHENPGKPGSWGNLGRCIKISLVKHISVSWHVKIKKAQR